MWHRERGIVLWLIGEWEENEPLPQNDYVLSCVKCYCQVFCTHGKHENTHTDVHNKLRPLSIQDYLTK